jgi:hypothetical protein
MADSPAATAASEAAGPHRFSSPAAGPRRPQRPQEAGQCAATMLRSARLVAHPTAVATWHRPSPNAASSAHAAASAGSTPPSPGAVGGAAPLHLLASAADVVEPAAQPFACRVARARVTLGFFFDGLAECSEIATHRFLPATSVSAAAVVGPRVRAWDHPGRRRRRTLAAAGGSLCIAGCGGADTGLQPRGPAVGRAAAAAVPEPLRLAPRAERSLRASARGSRRISLD